MSMDTYQEWLEERHSKMQTPHAVIEEAIKRAGERLVAKERVIVGEESEAYKITCESGQILYLRIGRENIDLLKEVWPIERCREMGVPVPKVRLAEEFLHAGDDGAAERLILSVTQAVPGRALADSDDLTETQLASIMAQAGEYLRLIHEVAVKGSGYLGPDGVGQADRTLADEFLHIRDEDDIWRAAADIGASREDVTTLLEAMRSTDAFDDREPKLVHGDFSLQHIFHDDDKVTGIIDFGDCSAFEPAHDFTWFRYFYAPRIGDQLLAPGYFGGDIPDDFERLIRLCSARMALTILPYFASGGNPYPKFAVGRLREYARAAREHR